MRVHLSVFVITLGLTLVACAQLKPDYWKQSVVPILVDSGDSLRPFGTGFFVRDTSITENLILVSNRHILSARQDIKVRLNIDDFSVIRGSQVLYNYTGSMDYVLALRDLTGRPVWVGHPDSSVDVAAIEILDVRNFGNVQIPFTYNTVVPVSYWLPWSRIQEGMRIAFAGFPDGKGSSAPSTPILRGGMIALNSTNPLDTVLIEAHSIGGSSGSPVFYVPELKLDGERIISSPPLLVGIVLGHENEFQSEIQINDTTYILSVGHSELSYMHTCDAIWETIAQLKK